MNMMDWKSGWHAVIWSVSSWLRPYTHCVTKDSDHSPIMLPEPHTNHKPTTLLTTYQPHITTLHVTYMYQPNTGTNLMHYYYKLLPTTYQPHTNHVTLPTTHQPHTFIQVPTTITMQPHTNHVTNHILQCTTLPTIYQSHYQPHISLLPHFCGATCSTSPLKRPLVLYSKTTP